MQLFWLWLIFTLYWQKQFKQITVKFLILKAPNSKNLNVSRFVLQLSLCNILKPRVKIENEDVVWTNREKMSNVVYQSVFPVA